MTEISSTIIQLQYENAELQARLKEAEETLHAIRDGKVDALVVSTERGEKVFTLEGADYPFRVLIESMSEGALTMTAEGVILFSNQRFADMLKRPLKNVIGSSLISWVTPVDQGLVRALLDHEAKMRRLAVLNFVDGDSALVPIQLSLIDLQVEDLQGTICVVATDLTERIQAEKALKESEMRYRSLVENANEGIVVIQDGIIVFANPLAEKIFGCSLLDFNNPVQLSEFVHPSDRFLILERSFKRLKGDQFNGTFHYRIIDGEGNIRFIEENAVEINWDGSPAILALIADITELKKIEEELLRADKLESIGLLAGGIAHDFNNYLAVLLGNINLARLYKDDNQKVFDIIKNLEKATISAKDLSNQLFTFATGGTPVVSCKINCRNKEK